MIAASDAKRRTLLLLTSPHQARVGETQIPFLIALCSSLRGSRWNDINAHMASHQSRLATVRGTDTAPLITIPSLSGQTRREAGLLMSKRQMIY